MDILTSNQDVMFARLLEMGEVLDEVRGYVQPTYDNTGLPSFADVPHAAPAADPSDEVKDSRPRADMMGTEAFHAYADGQRFYMSSVASTPTMRQVSAWAYRAWMARFFRNFYRGVFIPNFNIYMAWPEWAKAMVAVMYRDFHVSNTEWQAKLALNLTGGPNYDYILSTSDELDPKNPAWDYPHAEPPTLP